MSSQRNQHIQPCSQHISGLFSVDFRVNFSIFSIVFGLLFIIFWSCFLQNSEQFSNKFLGISEATLCFFGFVLKTIGYLYDDEHVNGGRCLGFLGS